MKYKRRIFLIDKPFQFRFSFYVCSWLFALSFVYPMIIYNLFEYFFHYMTLDPNGPTVEAIQTTRKNVLYLLAGFEVTFVVLTFAMSIFISHRIAGPVHKLKQFFRMNGNGKLSPEVYFRGSDHFKDVAKEYNVMLGAIRADLAQVHASVTASANDLDAMIAGGTDEAAKLKRIVLNLHTALEGMPK